MNIRFDELTERDLWEAWCKGYLCVKVEIDGKIYIVNVYDIARLQQDFQTEMEYDGSYTTEPNLIIVDEVTPEKIKLALEVNYKNKFFDEIGAVGEVK